MNNKLKLIKMKKVLKSALLFAVVGGMISLTSCSDEEAAGDGSAISVIKGKAQAEIIFDTAGLENAGSAVVIAKVNTKDYASSPDPNVTYDIVTYATTIASGSYSFDSIKVFNKPVTVTLTFSDFTADQETVVDTTRKIYSIADQTVTVGRGITKVLDVTYQ